METFCEHMNSFVEMNKGKNQNFQFWWQYMQMMVGIMLFIRAQKMGFAFLFVWTNAPIFSSI